MVREKFWSHLLFFGGRTLPLFTPICFLMVFLLIEHTIHRITFFNWVQTPGEKFSTVHSNNDPHQVKHPVEAVRSHVSILQSLDERETAIEELQTEIVNFRSQFPDVDDVGGVMDKLSRIENLLESTKLPPPQLDESGKPEEDVPAVELVLRMRNFDNDPIILMDRHSDKYILFSPGDGLNRLDEQLILDFSVVLVSSSIGGLLANAFKFPLLVGFLLGGSMVGPGGVGSIVEFVQVETLSQFGVIFLLFSAGCEFSYSGFRNAQRTSNIVIFGTSVVLIVVFWLIVPLWLTLDKTSSLFIGFSMCLASTHVIFDALLQSDAKDAGHAKITFSILLTNDIFLVSILLILKFLEMESRNFFLQLLLLVVKIVGFSVFVLSARAGLGTALVYLQGIGSERLWLLATLSYCLVCAGLTARIVHSPEVGAFVAGLTLSAAPETTLKKVESLMMPLKQVFGVLFYASIGMLLNPTFLWDHVDEVVGIALIVGLVKGLVSMMMLYILGHSSQVSGSVSLCLSQIGGNTFIVASHGYKNGYVDLHFYKVVLAVVALSILCTPFFVEEALNPTVRNDSSPRPKFSTDGLFSPSLSHE